MWVQAILEKFIRYCQLFVKEGAFISNVLDTTTVSDWGCIYWQAAQPGRHEGNIGYLFGKL